MADGQANIDALDMLAEHRSCGGVRQEHSAVAHEQQRLVHRFQ
jgi:hypothetical protein